MLNLFKEIQPIDDDGVHVGFLGHTGAGKSTLVNASYGEEVARVGLSQTTMQPTKYHHRDRGITFWDIPGSSDEISYFTTFYVSLMKRLNFRGLVITRTVTDVTNLIRLFECLELDYNIVVNKVDLGKETPVEYEDFKQVIEQEVEEYCNSAFCKQIFFISGKFLDQSDDWDKTMDGNKYTIDFT